MKPAIIKNAKTTSLILGSNDIAYLIEYAGNNGLSSMSAAVRRIIQDHRSSVCLSVHSEVQNLEQDTAKQDQAA